MGEKRDEGAALTAAVDQALSRGSELLHQRRRIQARLERLERAGGRQRALLAVRNQRSLKGTPLILVLMGRAKEERTRDPLACRDWATAAVEEGGELPGFSPSMLACAWAEKGNAERILDDFRSAQTSFRRAFELLESDGGGDPPLRGEIFSLFASYQYALHHPGEALACLDEAVECFKGFEMDVDRLKVTVQRANVRVFLGHFGLALEDLKAALAFTLTDPHPEDPLPLLAICHDAVGAATEIALATPNEGERRAVVRGLRQILPDILRLYESAPGGWCTRRDWLMGRLFLAQQRLPSAAHRLDSAMSDFLDRGQTATAAVVALDLALVFARERDFERVRDLAFYACEVFHTVGLEADAWAAHRALIECEETAMEATILDGLKKARGASLRRTPDPV